MQNPFTESEFSDFAQSTLNEFNRGFFNARCMLTKAGEKCTLTFESVLEPNVRGTCLTGEFVLIDQSLPIGKKVICLYHELGHLDYRRSPTGNPNAVDDEVHAYVYCLSRLETEERFELLASELDSIQGHIDARKNRDDHYPESFQKLFQHRRWNHWVEIADNYRREGIA
jgi:hypothetical protein